MDKLISYLSSLRDSALDFMQNRNRVLIVFVLIYSISSFFVWKKYDWNPSSQINFGKEFADQNREETPSGAIVFLGEKGDLGAGYDGQIFYYYSRMLSRFSLDWPKGFETEFRAPRIGYPLLVSPFGWFGKSGTIFGMYFVNLSLLLLSFFAIYDLIPEGKKYLASFHLLSPFTLGSYILLVSDTVMIGLLVLSYWSYKRERFLLFSLLGGLAILTKEQALFLLFPLGLEAVLRRDWKRSLWVSSVLILPGIWGVFLRYHLPSWSPTGLGNLLDPFGGLIGYGTEIWEGLVQTQASGEGGLKFLAKKLSRFPLLLLLLSGIFISLRGRISVGFPFRFGFLMVLVTVCMGGYVLYWATYENVSRMFAVSIPLLALWKSEDEKIPDASYWMLSGLVLVFFFVKLAIISKPLPFLIW